MVKKRRIDLVRVRFKLLSNHQFSSKRAQITIFMILGIILLFTFLFIIKLSSEVKLGELEAEKEKVLTKTFKKEALRIYVEDCLNDALEEGLVLIGRQGRIWFGQPGGTKVFTEKITGINYNSGTENNLVAYALAQETPVYPHAYPCDEKNQANDPPSFCRYQYPDTTVGFGELVLKEDILKEDLSKYLINRTIWCVHNFTESEISKYAIIEDTKIDLTLEIQNDGINVKVKYPLKMTIGAEEFFQISEFDFFYPSQLRGLLDAAVIRPLQNDQKYLDFAYDETVLKSPSFLYGSSSQFINCPFFISSSPLKNYFLCDGPLYSDKYQSLGIEMERKQLADGDDLFIFISPQILNLPEKYTFQVARQNRPPALDYVHRLECLDSPDPAYRYDYLVVKDDDTYGEINLELNATDPDEDEVVDYDFKPEFVGMIETPPNQFLVGKENLKDLEPKVYSLTVAATDEHGLSDWQEVRVLVDSPVTSKISLSLPYTLKDLNGDLKSYEEWYSSDNFIISAEDPIFLKINFPEDSLLAGISPKMFLKYDNAEGTEQIDLPFPKGSFQYYAGKEYCYSFPFNEGVLGCDLENYKDKIESWPEEIIKFDQPYFKQLTDTGLLKFVFSRNYCEIEELGNINQVNVRVAQCIPHRNLDHPYPYIPNDPQEVYNWKLVTDADGNEKFKTEEINPFLATHICCDDNWKVRAESYSCFKDIPEAGCFGSKEMGFIEGYILEEKYVEYYCDGKRGNICGGENGDNKEIIYQSSGECGISTYPDCTKVAKVCEDQFPYGIYQNIDGTSSWCHGPLGCGENKKACTSMIIDVDNDFKLGTAGDKCELCKSSFVGKKCKNLINNLDGTCQKKVGIITTYECSASMSPTLTNPKSVK